MNIILNILRCMIYIPRCAVCDDFIKIEDACAGFDGADTICPVCRPEYEKSKLEKCGVCGKISAECMCLPKILLGGYPKNDNITQNKVKSLQIAFYDRSKPDLVINKLIFYMKEHDDRRIFAFIGAELAKRIAINLSENSIKNTIITYVPRSSAAIHKFGFDHARRIAEASAKRLGVDSLPLIVRRSDGAGAQKTLNFAERIENAEQAFAPAGKYSKGRFSRLICGKTVVLVDDIITSGASMNACRNILLEMGSDGIICAAVCKGKM